MKGRDKHIEITFKPTNSTLYFRNIESVVRKMGIRRGTIYKYLKGFHKPPPYIIFREITEDEWIEGLFKKKINREDIKI